MPLHFSFLTAPLPESSFLSRSKPVLVAVCCAGSYGSWTWRLCSCCSFRGTLPERNDIRCPFELFNVEKAKIVYPTLLADYYQPWRWLLFALQFWLFFPALPCIPANIETNLLLSTLTNHSFGNSDCSPCSRANISS